MVQQLGDVTLVGVPKQARRHLEVEVAAGEEQVQEVGPLAGLLRPAVGIQPAEAAQHLGAVLPEDHPARAFFLVAATSGGFTVERA